jgi:hypothetical protein
MFAHTSTENAHIRAHNLRRGAISGRTTFRRDGRVPSTPRQIPSTLRTRPREKRSGSTRMPPPSPCHHDTMRGRSEKTRSVSCRSIRRGIESSTPTRGSHTISTRRRVKRAGRNRHNTKTRLKVFRIPKMLGRLGEKEWWTLYSADTVTKTVIAFCIGHSTVPSIKSTFLPCPYKATRVPTSRYWRCC